MCYLSTDSMHNQLCYFIYTYIYISNYIIQELVMKMTIINCYVLLAQVVATRT